MNNQNPNFTISLTPSEQELLEKVELDARALEHGEAAIANSDNAALLAESLISREAIPSQRWKVFSDDAYTTGRGPSPAAQFKRNGRSRAETLWHPHFLQYLRYFIYGPDLPESYIHAFAKEIHELGDLTSGDYETLRHFVRALTKRYRLIKAQADDVFRLSLEYDDDVFLAQTLRREAMKVSTHY